MHDGHPYSSEHYDQPEYRGEVRSYVICTTPRTGGTLLESLLHQTGQMGVPHEYFNADHNLMPMVERLGLPNPFEMGQYITRLLQKRTTPNGVFGLKLHYDQYAFARQKPSFQGLLRNSRAFIYVSRNDLMAQAVSFAIAHQSRNWSSLQPSKADVAYDGQLIENLMNEILMQHGNWQKFFAIHNIIPIRITYEDLLENPDRECRKITDALDVEIEVPFTLKQSIFDKQRNELNDEWIMRFRKERTGS